MDIVVCKIGRCSSHISLARGHDVQGHPVSRAQRFRGEGAVCQFWEKKGCVMHSRLKRQNSERDHGYLGMPICGSAAVLGSQIQTHMRHFDSGTAGF